MNTKQWLLYWKDCLNYATIKPIETNNLPINVPSIQCPYTVPNHLVGRLLAQSRNTQGLIDIAICPAQSSLFVDSQKTQRDIQCLFWIPASMDSQGKMYLQKKHNKVSLPFFARDFLQPNPPNYVRISNVETIDRKLSQHNFYCRTWAEYWAVCESFFQSVTDKTFTEFNTLIQPQVYFEIFSNNDFAWNIRGLYDQLLSSPEINSRTSLLNTIIHSNDKDKLCPPEQPDVLQNTKHVGQFSGEFPLSHSQRISMCALTDDENNEVIAINGPPGTGKTTLLQSIVANLVVESVLNDEPAPLILASSTNNQAITNILNGFKLPDDDNPLTARWLPDVSSLGLYMTTPKKNKAYQYYDLVNSRTTGFFASYEARDAGELIDSYLSHFNSYFAKCITNISSARPFIKKQIDKKINNIEDELKLALMAESAEAELKKRAASIEILKAEKEREQKAAKKFEHEADSAKWTMFDLKRATQKRPLLEKIFFFLKHNKAKKIEKHKIIIGSLSQHLNIDNWLDVTQLNKKLADYSHTAMTSALEHFGKEEELGKQIAYLLSLKEQLTHFESHTKAWDKCFGQRLINLYNLTGEEYQDLTYLEDMNVRLDISHRFEVFWLALHYREAEYLEKLSARQDAGRDDAEFGEHTYKQKLQRYACLTPIFISTFHSAPKYSQYFSATQQQRNYYSELYDLLIVDEAGQVSPVVAIPTFSLAKKAVVVGDALQIEPTYPISEELDYSCLLHRSDNQKDISDEQFIAWQQSGKLGGSGSLMQMAQAANKFAHSKQMSGLLLTEHRRCIDQIISYSNQYVYNGSLDCKRGRKPAKNLDFINVKTHIQVAHPSERRGSSRINRQEADYIAQWIATYNNDLVKAYQKPIDEIVAVITPYKTQSFEVKSALAKVSNELNTITVGTTHALQGAERPVILFSLVLSPSDSLMFINQKYNLLNVAISRARDYFVLFGDANTLAASEIETPLGSLNKWVYV